jgi:hypothetical protein
MNRLYPIGLLLLLLAAACHKKDDPVNTPATGNVTITIQNMCGTDPLTLNTVWYKNANGDSIRISKFNYFISNIKLVKDDGSTFAEVESYHLIQGDKESSKTFSISNVPFGTYKSMSFIIGVDSARNVSGAQTGDLDPASGMFWDWNTGYVMAKMEAESPQAIQTGTSVIYHLGGYGGDVNVLRTVSLQLPSLTISKDKLPNLHMKADAMEWFKTPNLIKVKDLSVLAGKNAYFIADNYVDMFSVDHVD